MSFQLVLSMVFLKYNINQDKSYEKCSLRGADLGEAKSETEPDLLLFKGESSIFFVSSLSTLFLF